MKALVFHGPGVEAWEDVARPIPAADTDAFVQVDTTTICGALKVILSRDSS
jgi:alcohol dehydrogenase